MKAIKYILSIVLLIAIVWSCKKVEDNFDFVSTAKAPADITALFGITQDNTGLVTITPNGVGAISYDIIFGDTTTTPANLKQGQSVKHTYAEGNYQVIIAGIGITGLKTEITQDLEVSFKAPENLEVTIENDLAVSKKVNVTANADYATLFEVYFGEVGFDEPVTANIGETASYIYQEAGTYTIRVVVKGGAIQTAEYTEEVVVTAILQPTASAPTPPSRLEADVISIYSAVYTDVAGTNYNPDWGQSAHGSGFAEFDLNGDLMLQYINLSYQGIGLAALTSVDVSAMEFLHMDIWTAEVDSIETFLINGQDGNSTEKSVWTVLTADAWTRIDIPISAYTDQGLTVNEIFQLKFVSDSWVVNELAGGTVFIDNIYFYKAASNSTSVTPITFETGFEMSSFDGGDIAMVPNPDAVGNTSDMVLKLVKGAGQVWAGSKLTVSNPFSVSNTTITAKVWSPRVGLKLLLKYEDATAWPNTVASAEIEATTTVANEWEELTFDFAGIATDVDFVNLVLIMDNGTAGDASADYTLFVDDISAELSFDFEIGKVLSSFDGGDMSVVTNPDVIGNPSALVGKLVKGAGQVWAGSKITSATPFSFATTTVTVKVYSPRVGLELLMKFEDATPWPNTVATAEVTATTTVANQWEELTFDFSGIDTAVDFLNLVLIMDNGTAGDGSSDYTLFVDDIAQN